jgi:hypothetical protein
LAHLVSCQKRVIPDVVNFVLARHGGELFDPRRIMSAVVPTGGGGFGAMVRRKPW